jgi:hypothetical protein
VSPVKCELGFYIPEDDILHSHCRENLKSYIVNRFPLFNENRMLLTVLMRGLFSNVGPYIASGRGPVEYLEKCRFFRTEGLYNSARTCQTVTGPQS